MSFIYSTFSTGENSNRCFSKFQDYRMKKNAGEVLKKLWNFGTSFSSFAQ